MLTMTDRREVVANSTSLNVLSGKSHEFVPFRSVVTLYATAEAIGLNVTFLVGGTAIVDDQEVNAANRMPIIPDDYLAQAVCRGGERLVVRGRNTTAGAIDLFTRIDVNPF
jgi:hypothetical protein